MKKHDSEVQIKGIEVEHDQSGTWVLKMPPICRLAEDDIQNPGVTEEGYEDARREPW